MPYTPLEERNLATIRALRAAAPHERGRYLAPGAVVHRHGFHHLPASSGTRFDHAAIPDRVDHVQDLIAKDDRVWAVWTIRGTWTSPLFGLPPTGGPVEILELGIWRLMDGQVVEAWFLADELALTRS